MKIRSVVLAVVAAFSAPLVLACGPDFPPVLLGDRASTLLDLPEGTFDFEASHLIKPATAFPVVERADWLWANPPPPTQDDVERGWLGDAFEVTRLMRSQPTSAAAWAKGTDLSAEARLYTTGAVAFGKAEYEEAAARFKAVLALPADQRSHYGVLAQFMLGRIALLREDVDIDAAHAAFRATRELVAAGATDPLGLAATSLGDEAWISLHNDDDAGAIALYAQQAALGSAFGRTSLLEVARDIVHDAKRLQRAVSDPLSQRLLVAYFYSRSDELQYDDSAEEGPKRVPDTINTFLKAVEQAGLDKIDGADRLAAVVYRQGNYELAKRIAAKSDAPLAQWVRAKLALRDGDLTRAADAYAAASKGFPRDERWQAPGTQSDYPWDGLQPACRVEGEYGALDLSRGEYVSALTHLFAASDTYWADAAYVAERVVTVDELKTFVDTKVPATPVVKPTDGSSPAMTRANLLRALLARRLLRANRYDDALRYFDDAEIKAKAQTYVDARRAAEKGDRIAQARGWFRSAELAREDGMEILGYEMDPDFNSYGGSFDLNWQGDDGAARKDLVLPEKWRGNDEQQRLAASVAVPLKRFHYRYVAAEFAAKAADLLPPRSQAFAAALCTATSYVLHDDQQLGEKYWLRYVKQGPYVPWAANFGLQCQAPDFDAAERRLRAERIASMKRSVRHAAPYIAGGLVLLGVALVLQWRRRRKQA